MLKKLKTLLRRNRYARRQVSLKTKETTSTTRTPGPVKSGVKLKSVSARQVFTALSLVLFEKPGRGLSRLFELDKLFNKAGMNVHPIKYSAETIFMTFIIGALGTVGFITKALTTRLTPVETLIGILVVTAIPTMVFTVRLAIPYVKAVERKNEVENELPFFMAYVATMVRGGFSLEKIIERVARLRVFKAIRKEAQRVVTLIRVFGDDPVTALEKVVYDHPSTRFRDIILGYTTTLRTGGDVTHYLEIRAREVFEHRASEIKSIAGRMLSILEVYMIFGVIVSLSLFVFFTTSAVISAAQVAQKPQEIGEIKVDISMPSFYNFVVLPFIGIVASFAIHLIQPRTPVSYLDVLATLAISAPISMATFILLLVFTGGIGILEYRIGPTEVRSLSHALSASLIVLSAFPAASYIVVTRRRRGMVRSVASFLRDISEIRKTGLSPEKSIILVSSRDYKSLTPVIQKFAISLVIGFDLEESMKKALKGIKEWFTVASMRFLVDSIVVGGGSPEVIDTLARFIHSLSELEEETRRRVKAQIFIPYLGAILLATGPLVLLHMLTSLAKIPVSAMTPLILTLVVGCILNSYIMGLVAGKAVESTVTAGFIHAIILTVVTSIALSVSFSIMGI